MVKWPVIILLSVFLFAEIGFCQFDVLDKAKEKIEEELNKSKEQKNENEKKEETTESKKEDVNQNSDEGSELKSFSKFDFVPGENVLMYEDFSQDNVGDFPDLWNTNSSGEIVTFNNYPGHWFQFGNNGDFMPDVNGAFGENFTLEFDLLYTPPAASNLPPFQIDFISGKSGDEQRIDATNPGKGGCSFRIAALSNQVYDWKENGSGNINNSKNTDILFKNLNKKVHVSFSFQKQRVREWLNEEKIYDLPRLLSPGLQIDRLRFTTWQTNEQTPYFFITNLRVAVGPPDMRNKLITDGKLVTRGILFDVNSDKIKPESYGTLKEIAAVLKENSSIKVKIIGHTDSDGDDNNNLELSKKRSASVKNALVSEFEIESVRLETDGKGESEPVSDNSTVEGKANNRRVEFIRL